MSLIEICIAVLILVSVSAFALGAFLLAAEKSKRKHLERMVDESVDEGVRLFREGGSR